MLLFAFDLCLARKRLGVCVRAACGVRCVACVHCIDIAYTHPMENRSNQNMHETMYKHHTANVRHIITHPFTLFAKEQKAHNNPIQCNVFNSFSTMRRPLFLFAHFMIFSILPATCLFSLPPLTIPSLISRFRFSLSLPPHFHVCAAAASLGNRIKLLTPTSLAIYKVGRNNKGMYQCLVTNKGSSAQAMAELKLGGKFKKLSYTIFQFITFSPSLYLSRSLISVCVFAHHSHCIHFSYIVPLMSVRVISVLLLAKCII